MTPAIVFRASTSRVYAIGTWVVAAVVLVAFAVEGGAGEVVSYGAVPLLLAVLGWAAFWRPQVRVEPAGVRVVNVLSTAWLPWAAITETRTRWGLELIPHEGRKIGAWALPARGALGRGTGRRDAPVLPPLERLETVVSGGSDPRIAAGLVEGHRTGGTVPEGAAVERRLDAAPVGALLVGAALVALTLLR